MLNRSASLAMSTCVLKALPGKLDIKRHSPSILYMDGASDLIKLISHARIHEIPSGNDNVFVRHQRIQRGTYGPKGSNCFSTGSVPVFHYFNGLDCIHHYIHCKSLITQLYEKI